MVTRTNTKTYIQAHSNINTYTYTHLAKPRNQRMLIKDPEHRPSAGELLGEPLISDYVKVSRQNYRVNFNIFV